MARAANSDELRAAFDKHEGETEGQVERLEQVFQISGETPKGKTCDAIMGIIEEGQEIMKEYKGTPALDAGLLAAAQSVEHYGILVTAPSRPGRACSGWTRPSSFGLHPLGREEDRCGFDRTGRDPGQSGGGSGLRVSPVRGPLPRQDALSALLSTARPTSLSSRPATIDPHAILRPSCNGQRRRAKPVGPILLSPPVPASRSTKSMSPRSHSEKVSLCSDRGMRVSGAARVSWVSALVEARGWVAYGPRDAARMTRLLSG